LAHRLPWLLPGPHGHSRGFHSAALRTLPVSATAEKYLILAMSIVSLSLTVEHKDLVIANGQVK
jgi:hypothetical protein